MEEFKVFIIRVYVKNDYFVLSGYFLYCLKENIKVVCDVYFYFFKK